MFPKEMEVPRDQCRTYLKAITSAQVRKVMRKRYPEAINVVVSLVRS